MNSTGNISVSWPYSSDFDFAGRFPQIRSILTQFGFDHRAVTSSSFVLFRGDEQSAIALRERLQIVDPEFKVEWTPETT